MVEKSPDLSPDSLLRTWLKRTRESQFAHYTAANRLEKRHYVIGIPAAVLSAIVGTSVFASIGANVETWVKILVGLVSILAAVLSGLQTFWRFSERAERHRKTASQYGNIRREVEQDLTFAGQVTNGAIEELRKRLDAAADQAPSVVNKDWTTAKRTADQNYYGAGAI